jgi:maleate isomerase
MSKRIRLGILTPSSNTALEPLTQNIISQLGDDLITVHFSRFRVLKIALSADALAQFDNTPIIEAAKLLADAHVDVIGWSGTSSGWLGFAQDEKLCAEITAATGIPATTSVLALNKLVQRLGIKKMSLLTPYTDDVQSAIMKNYASIGVDCSLESHLGWSDNASFGNIPEATLDGNLKDLVRAGAKAVSVFCTGLRAAHLVADWETQHDIVVLDTIPTVIWEMLWMAGVDTTRITGWGRLFQVTL